MEEERKHILVEEEEEVGLKARQSRSHNEDNNVESEIANEDTANGSQEHNANVPTFTNSFYFDKQLGIESINGVSETKLSGIDLTSETNSSDAKTFLRDFEVTEGINHQNGETLDNKVSSGSILTPVDSSFEQQCVKDKPSNNETVTEDYDIIEEIDQEFTELDVERVIEKQTTHDLYCPNCHSCITKKVILRRRKTKIRNAHRKPKPDKSETNYHPQLDTKSTYPPNYQDCDTVNTSSNGSQELAANDEERDGKPDVFRCLSCFSFFIPTRSGFKLFLVFGNNPENECIKDAPEMHAANKNWRFSIFTRDKRRTTAEQGAASQVAGDEILCSSAEVGKNLEGALPIVREKSENVTEKAKTGVDSVNRDAIDPVQEMTLPISLDNMKLQQENGHLLTAHAGNLLSTKETSEDASLIPQQDGANSSISSTCELMKPKQSQMKMDENFIVAIQNEQSVQNGEDSSIQGILSTTNLLLKEDRANNPFALTQGRPIVEKVKTYVEEKAVAVTKKGPGNDVIVVVETGPMEPASSQSEQDINVSVELGSLQRIGEQTAPGLSVDILKSIVYGGLIESITSLGIIFSAAGAGAATLNILALSLANLVGGLFIIGHNLVDLKNDHSGGSSNEMNVEEDRYQETLGRRENFPLHAVVAIMSFFIFGLLPPVIYGFSFRKSANKDLKLAVVGGVSLVCIILLAIGKAHVQRQPKSYVRTAMYYFGMGIMASGASFIVGDLLSKLFEKVGWFESSSAFMVPFHESELTKTAWVSY